MPSSRLSPEKSMTPQNSSAKLLTLRNFSVLGDVFKETGKLREAEDLYRSGLQGREKVLGCDHPETLTAAHNLSLILEAQRKFTDAEELFRSTIDARQRVFGKNHPATCSTAYCLGDMLRKLGRKAEAIEWIDFALQGYVEFLGEEHANTKLCRRVLKNLKGGHASCVIS